MIPSLNDLEPLMALAAVRAVPEKERAEAWQALDRTFRWQVLRRLRDGEGPEEGLRQALLELSADPEAVPAVPWGSSWELLLQLLRDAAEVPSRAADLDALGAAEGRAGQLLALLAARHPDPQRPTEMAAALGLAPNHISNLIGPLQEAGLLIRRRGDGKASWLFPTARGLRVATRLPGAGQASVPQVPPGQVLPGYWDPEAVSSDVDLDSAAA